MERLQCRKLLWQMVGELYERFWELEEEKIGATRHQKTTHYGSCGLLEELFPPASPVH